jgi:hypothetical protein
MNMMTHLAMHANIETVTPDQAAALLANNAGNRKLMKTTVSQLADDMRRGHWRLSHQGIAIARDGRLLDGQHRLSAIVEAGVAVQMVVFRNVDEASFAVMDRGRVRQLRDILGQDSRILEPCTFIARLHGIGMVQAHHAEEVLAAVGPAVVDMLAVAGACAKGRTAAPIKAAAALRLVQGHKDHVLRQWKALVNMEFTNMAPAIQSLFRQITEERSSGGVVQNERAARAWFAFDPARANVSRILIRDVQSINDEMRAVWRPSWAV